MVTLKRDFLNDRLVIVFGVFMRFVFSVLVVRVGVDLLDSLHTEGYPA